MPYWTPEQEMALMDMVEEGKSLEELAEYFHRSQEAIRLKLKRMGLPIPVTKKNSFSATTTTSMETLPAITPAAELISMHEMMQILLGALDQLRNRQSLSSLEIKRFRLIAHTARTYMHMLERYEKWAQLEQRLVDMEARTLEIYKLQLVRETDPVRKAEVEVQIKQLEESLAQSSKYYKPFEKKLSLMAPTRPGKETRQR